MSLYIPRPSLIVDAVLPDPDEFFRQRGQRLHVKRTAGMHVEVMLEHAPPEQVGKAKAEADVLDELHLDENQCRWLRDRLTDCLMSFAAEMDQAS